MDVEQVFNALPMINHFSAVAAIGCVFPTYFHRLRPATYRLLLSIGIVFGLSPLAVAITTVLLASFSDPAIRLLAINMLLWCSPLAIVLMAILARIKRLIRARLWSTVVLTCIIVDWVGMASLISALS
ncbi:hypothetical protein JQ616_16500 [Bradyrhizobium tropiciagri]|uniref:hypothetical protein n=1 Tax=Bradyrhizobium tropiciagri TaxID=312253 RepID=UPI001BA581F3|nr:hypothetical protein [Bradyrhizobium tropiciagri]MBR0896564.1 hypothetical protein [Bradyrhizobium tropiciagri]